MEMRERQERQKSGRRAERYLEKYRLEQQQEEWNEDRGKTESEGDGQGNRWRLQKWQKLRDMEDREGMWRERWREACLDEALALHLPSFPPHLPGSQSQNQKSQLAAL